MRIGPISELGVVLLLSILLVVIIVAVPSNPLRVVLGLPFLLLFPGYAIVAALFPRKSDLGGVERLGLSFGLSIAAIPLVGLILNYTPWGIGLYSILAAVVIFILVVAAIASYRRHLLPADERFLIKFNMNLREWPTLRGWDRALSLILVALTLGAIGTAAYAATTPHTGERYTEFYVLGPGGTTEGYPESLPLGEQATVILGIVNHEDEDGLEYHADILIDGRIVKTIGPLALDQDQQWEQEISFTPVQTGPDQLVEFLLYRQGEDDPCGSLHLRIEVTSPG